MLINLFISHKKSYLYKIMLKYTINQVINNLYACIKKKKKTICKHFANINV